MLNGLAGECAVMKELCLKGWIPSMAYNNCPTFDILCHNQESQKSIAIQVKTVREKEDGKTIAMARLLFDYGYTAYISDVIVLPKYQGQGIGRHMLEAIFSFVEHNSISGEYISYFLQAAAGKEEFYEKFGFIRRPQGEMGAGMTKRISDKE